MTKFGVLFKELVRLKSKQFFQMLAIQLVVIFAIVVLSSKQLSALNIVDVMGSQTLFQFVLGTAIIFSLILLILLVKVQLNAETSNRFRLLPIKNRKFQLANILSSGFLGLIQIGVQGVIGYTAMILLHQQSYVNSEYLPPVFQTLLIIVVGMLTTFSVLDFVNIMGETTSQLIPTTGSKWLSNLANVPLTVVFVIAVVWFLDDVVGVLWDKGQFTMLLAVLVVLGLVFEGLNELVLDKYLETRK